MADFGVMKSSKFYSILLFCQYLWWAQYARNRVQWTRFVRVKNEFNELSFSTHKSSSMNSFCKTGKRVH